MNNPMSANEALDVPLTPKFNAPNQQWSGVGTGGGGVLPAAASFGQSTASTASEGRSNRGFNAATGEPSLADGGVVPEDTDNDQDDDTVPHDESQESAPVDTGMDVIKQALQFGRQSMGLPVDFFGTGNSTQSFDDGGAVMPEDENQVTDAVTNTQPPVNPQNTLKYLLGDGAVSPEIARALEQHVDPQGMMSPAERAVAAVQSAPNPEAQFGMLQHYRTKHNAYAGAARAALDQGNMGAAARYATQAMANVPTGKSVSFAPARGGLAMMSRPVAGKQRAFDDGGAVDVTNPTVLEKQKSGGRMPGFDDGGEVAQEDTGVLPPEETTADSEIPEAATPTEGETPPQVIPADQAKSLMSAGFDKIAEAGDVTSILGGDQGPYMQPTAPAPSGAQDQTQPTVNRALKGDRLTTVAKTPAPEQPPSTPPAKETGPMEDPLERQRQMLESRASKLFPWASQAPQREKYVTDALERIEKQSGAEKIETIKGDVKKTNEAAKQAAIGQRATTAQDAKKAIALLNAQTKQMTTAQVQGMKLINNFVAQKPNANPDEIMQLAEKYFPGIRQHIQTSQPTMPSAGGQPTSQETAPQQAPPVGSTGRTIVVFPSGPYAGKPMYRMPDGTYTPAIK